MDAKTSRRGLIVGAAAAAGAPWIRALSPAVVAAATPDAPGRPEAALPPIDTARIAGRIGKTLSPRAGERAVLVFDPGYYPELAAAIQRELVAAGVELMLSTAFDPPEVVRAVEARAGGPRRQDEFVSWLAPVFQKADLFLWLPARSLYSDTRLEHLIDGSHARGIHFHWILGFEGRSAEEIVTLSRLYERVILETDYAALSRRQDRLIAALAGRGLHLTTPDGTDLRLQVPAGAWFHKNDGDMSPARAKRARSARDREMELPAGALRFIPDPVSVAGRLVVHRVSTPGGAAEGVVLEFEAGRVRRLQAASGEDAFRKEWEGIGGDVDKVGEIVLGTNPLLAGKTASGELPYFGYGAGAVRVSLGDNWESGGANRTSRNRNWWLFLDDASLEAGDEPIVRGGKLVSAD